MRFRSLHTAPPPSTHFIFYTSPKYGKISSLLCCPPTASRRSQLYAPTLDVLTPALIPRLQASPIHHLYTATDETVHNPAQHNLLPPQVPHRLRKPVRPLSKRLSGNLDECLSILIHPSLTPSHIFLHQRTITFSITSLFPDRPVTCIPVPTCAWLINNVFNQRPLFCFALHSQQDLHVVPIQPHTHFWDHFTTLSSHPISDGFTSLKQLN